MPRFIFVGDIGICESNSLVHLESQGHGWVVSKSIAKSKKTTKDWIYNEEGYIYSSPEFKHKSKIETRVVKNADGVVIGKLTEKIVVYWSKAYYEKQKYENKSFTDFINKLKEKPTNFKFTSSYKKLIKKFLKDDVTNIRTGEVISSKDLIAMTDDEKVKSFENEMGYYQIVTSELEKDDLEIIDIYHGLSQIEEQFGTMKGTLDTKPIHLRTEEHIHAHLVLCTLALIVMRVIQNKIVDYQNINCINRSTITKNKITRNKYWEFGLNSDRLQEALNKWTVDMLADGYYRFNNIDDKDLKLILDSFNINIEKKLYQKQDLRTLKTSIKIIT